MSVTSWVCETIKVQLTFDFNNTFFFSCQTNLEKRFWFSMESENGHNWKQKKQKRTVKSIGLKK